MAYKFGDFTLQMTPGGKANPSSQAKSFEIRFDDDSRALVVEFIGSIGMKNLVDSLSALVKHEKFHTDMPACFDFSNAQVDIDLSSTETIYHFAEGLRQKRGDDYRLAFVYSDEMTKTLLNFYRLFFSRTTIDVEVFNDAKLAIKWIKDSRTVESGKSSNIVDM